MNDEWRALAACKGMDPNLFFPESSHPEQATIPILICRDCVVRQECLDEALSDPVFGPYGIRGGISARERKRMRFERRQRSRTMSA